MILLWKRHKLPQCQYKDKPKTEWAINKIKDKDFVPNFAQEQQAEEHVDKKQQLIKWFHGLGLTSN